MKIALITDLHFGARNDSANFMDYYEKFYTNIFFPKLKEEGVTKIIILGDTFDRRKYINFNTLKRAKEMFFKPAQDNGISIDMIVGNHDLYFRNTAEVSSVGLLLGEFNNINVIDEPKTLSYDNTEICLIPWICAENQEQCLEHMQSTKALICCGHFEIEGFSMYRGQPAEEGLSKNIFNKFELTFSGHYHHKSDAGGIHYLGNPYQLTWQDYEDDRGFHILDLTDRELTFIKNPYTMFERLVYDDKANQISEIASFDFSPCANKYLKVVVVNKTNPYLFDVYMGNLYQVNPADVNVIEDFMELTEGLEDDIINEAEDTITILNKYVDSVAEDSVDPNKLKSILRELYVEALNLEQA